MSAVEPPEISRVDRRNQLSLLLTGGSRDLAVAGAAGLRQAPRDLQVQTTDTNCEDPTEELYSLSQKYVARYTNEACDYGFGSNIQDAWIDVEETASPERTRIQVF